MATNRPSYSVNLGLSALPEVDNPELFNALSPIYNAIRNTMYAVDAYTGNSLLSKDEYAGADPYTNLLVQRTSILLVKASEAITVGHAVNLWSSSGLRARKATNTNTPDAMALATAAIGDVIPVCLFGLVTVLGGLTEGAAYYPTATPGVISTTVLGTKIGKALAANALWFAP